MAQPPQQNRILSRLSEADFALLVPHLEPADLPLRRYLSAAASRSKPSTFLKPALPPSWPTASQSPSKSGSSDARA